MNFIIFARFPAAVISDCIFFTTTAPAPIIIFWDKLNIYSQYFKFMYLENSAIVNFGSFC